MSFLNSSNDPVDIDFEKDEQMLVKKYIPHDGTVLELGARYGTVSCLITSILDDPTRHVAVEPDSSVIEALEKNRDRNGGKFHIFNGVVSNKNFTLKRLDCCEYGTYTEESDVPSLCSLSLDKLQNKYNLKFDCLVADCEGFFPQFIDENTWVLDQVRVIIYEKDGIPWDGPRYEALDRVLTEKGFVLLESIPHPKWKNNPTYNSAWVKTSGK